MENSDIRKTKETIKRIIKYIFYISPKYFYLNIIFTILVGLTSAMSIWSTKLLINGIVNINTNNNFIKILITYGVINIFIQIIQSLNSYINSKHQLKIDYKMSMDILEKCVELRLQNFEDSEIYNILGRAEMEGQTKVYISYRNILSIITQIASIISVSIIILSWDSYIFLLIFITPIISTIIMSITFENVSGRV